MPRLEEDAQRLAAETSQHRPLSAEDLFAVGEEGQSQTVTQRRTPQGRAAMGHRSHAAGWLQAGTLCALALFGRGILGDERVAKTLSESLESLAHRD